MNNTTPKILSPTEIKDIRNTLGISQEAFAKEIWQTTSSVVAWENGKRRPSGAASKLMLLIAGKLKR